MSAGLNLRLSAFQAAVLNAQLQLFETEAELRESNGRFLDEALNDIAGIHCAERYARTGRNAYHLLIFTYDPGAFSGLPKARFLEALLAEGVVATEGYRPLQKLPFVNHAGAPLPITEQLCRDQVWLRQFELLGAGIRWCFAAEVIVFGVGPALVYPRVIQVIGVGVETPPQELEGAKQGAYPPTIAYVRRVEARYLIAVSEKRVL